MVSKGKEKVCDYRSQAGSSNIVRHSAMVNQLVSPREKGTGSLN